MPPKTPLTPAAVRDNIKSGLEQRVVDPHIKDSLSEDFEYKVDTDAQGSFPNFPFTPWDKGREVRFMQTVLESGTRPDSVTFGVPQFSIRDDFQNTQRWLIEYKWTLVFRDSTQTSGKRRDIYNFQALWTFVGVTAGNVKLSRWEELQPPSQPDARSKGSSGFLRGDSGVR